MKKAAGWRVKVSPEQVAWAERRLRHGGRVLVAVRKRTDLWIFSGWQLRQLKDERLDKVPGHAHAGGPSAWDWYRIAASLLEAPLYPDLR
jgi:hypothetical protein